jgi:NADH-quinone oxidoreductase subunit G
MATVDKAATAASDSTPPTPAGHVRLTVDGVDVLAPDGEVLIRTCERLGIEIPRFCDHPLLDPIAACRQCLVEVEMGGRKMPKPQPSCAMTVASGMVVQTQLTSPIARRAQNANLEFLLINHPLDCPMCDKGGECPLQNQDLDHGPGESRFHEAKRVFIKPVPISTEILLDRDRCVLCYRCTRFSEQIAGDPFIDMLSRSVEQQVGIGPERPFRSYFSGNTIQICPVGALTSTAYRFRARPFDLVSSPTVCEHCAAGCALRTDHRSNVVLRRLAGDDPQVNQEWNCDKGRFAFNYYRAQDRLTSPLVRGVDGELAPASWTAAMTAAAEGLKAARDRSGVGVLAGGRLTVTDAYSYAKFARLALGTNDIDFRARDHSAEEMDFLARRVVGTSPASGGVTYTTVEHARTVLLVALEPQDECPILFLRLRKANRGGTAIIAVAPLASEGLAKMGGTLLPTEPGTEAAVLSALSGNDLIGGALSSPGALILVGERAAQVAGLLTAVGELADSTGAGLAWVPRRAGERGALLAGAAPTMLPGGRPVIDDVARGEVESSWGVVIPAIPGRDTARILAAASSGDLAGLLIGGIELEDLPDPAAARAAIAKAGFVVSLELRHSEVTELADVVFPVAAAAEKSGAYLDWEGRLRPFETALEFVGGLDDARVLDTLGVEMDVDLFTQTPQSTAADLARLGGWTGAVSAGPPVSVAVSSAGVPEVGQSPVDGSFVLAAHRALLDGSRAEDGEPHLAGTRRPEVVRLSAAAAAGLGAVDGAQITVSGPAGSLSLPLALSQMSDSVVWVPAKVGGRSAMAVLGSVVAGRVAVTCDAGGAANGPDSPRNVDLPATLSAQPTAQKTTEGPDVHT